MERDEVALGEQLLERQERRAERRLDRRPAARWTSWYRIRIPKPFARRATAWPIRPKPTIPIVAPWTSGPEQQQRAPGLPAARRGRSGRPPGRRRAAAMSSAQARSAVVSVRTPGVLPTATPRRVHAGDVDVVEADRVVADDLELRARPRRGTRRRPGRSAASGRRRSPRPRRSSSSRGGGSSSCQTSASQAARDRVEALVGDPPRDEDLRSARAAHDAGAADAAARRTPGSAPSASARFSREFAYEIRMWSSPTPPNAVPARTQTPASWSSRSASSAPVSPVPEMSGKT